MYALFHRPFFHNVVLWEQVFLGHSALCDSSPFYIEKAAHLLQGKGGNVPACLSKTEA